MTEKIANELKNIKENDKNLYDHLKQLIASLSLDRADVNRFEEYSSSQRIGEPSEECVFKVRQAYAHLKDYEVKHRSLVGKLNSGTEQEPQEPASIGYVPDFNEESRVFQKFGIGFGEEETYRIFKSLSKFSLKKNAKQVRLWGKIIGSEKDYYIAQGVADGGEEAGELSADTEPKGTGANKYTFWATNELVGDWSELPIVTPSQVRTSRCIKYNFTGDLTRSILTNPLFPGKEAHLLKCQLVRITNTCTIIPKGMFVVNAENPNQIDAPEEYAFPDVALLAEKENWVYHNVSLLKNGRVTLIKPEGLEPEEQDKILKQMAAKDPTEPRLKNIVLDSQNWSLKGYNLDETYKTLGKVPKIVCKGAVGLKNLIWPGWLTVSFGGKTSSIYVGYGHKFKQNYYPFDPEKILSERQDKSEYVVKE